MVTMSGPPAIGASWFDRQQPNSSWSSIAVSMVATAALFASAAIAVRSAPAWFELQSQRAEPPVVVHLSTPLTAQRPRPAQHPADVVVPKPEAVRPAVVVPANIPVGVIPERPTAATTVTSTPLANIPRAPTLDSGARREAIVPRLGAPTHPPLISHPAVVITPAGLTEHRPLTKAERDSLDAAEAAEWAALLKQPVDGEARAQIEQSQRNQAMLHKSASGAGGGSGYTPGNGVDGVGTVKPGAQSAGAGGATNTTLLSIPFPLFYPGPSPQQRKRDSIVNADNRARLARLHARADSLAKVRADSIAKARIIP